MSGSVRTARIVWTIIFLSITLAAIVMEVVAGVFHPAGTIPWTEYIAKYVPWPIQLTAYVALAVWLPFHFWRHDHLRKVAYDQGVRMGRRLGRTEAYENGRIAGWHEGVAGKPMPTPVGPGKPSRDLLL